MLEWRLWGVRCRVSLLFPALVTALLLWKPDGLAVSCLLASLIHEGGHLAAMLAMSVPPKDCVLSAFGMRLELGSSLVSYGRNLMIALAGPLANGLAATLLFIIDSPIIATIHLALAGLNLLPAGGLDGGEVLRCGFGLLGLDGFVEPILRFFSAAVLLPLATVGIWLFLRMKNPTLVIVSGYLVALIFFSDKCEKTS